jgi:hypothetical protein
MVRIRGLWVQGQAGVKQERADQVGAILHASPWFFTVAAKVVDAVDEEVAHAEFEV